MGNTNMDWTQVFTIIFSISGILYWFKSDLQKDINRLDTEIKVQSTKIDGLNIKITEIDKRLYGIETVLHMKDCCVLKQDQSLKKVE